MDEWEAGFGEKSRLKALLDHFSEIEDPRPSHKVAYPLSEVLLLAVCGTIADCDSFEAIGISIFCGDFCRTIIAFRRGDGLRC